MTHRFTPWLALWTGVAAVAMPGCSHPPVQPPQPAAELSAPLLVLRPPAPAPPTAPPPMVLAAKAPSAPAPVARQRLPRTRMRQPYRRSIRKMPPPLPPPAAPAPELNLNTGDSPTQQAAALRATGHWLWLCQQRLSHLGGSRLDPNQTANRTQAEVYMQQSEQAQRRGDYDRAQNLAYKAWLLLQALR